MSTRRRGFTLIELLVVISIIALLLSILMPALNKAKEHAQVVTCKSNLHNYGLAVSAYFADNDDKFCSPHDWLAFQQNLLNRGIPGSCLWHAHVDPAGEPVVPDGQLWPYLENKDVHLCGTMEKVTKGAKSMHAESSSHNPNIPIVPRFSYSMNWALGQSGFYGGILRLSSVSRTSSEVGIFTEESPYIVNVTDSASFGGLNDTFFFSKWDLIAPYHKMKSGDYQSGQGNVVFLDGHVATHYWRDSLKKFWPHSEQPFHERYDTPWVNALIAAGEDY